ncbi:MAG TPA: hypothetical protein V6D33_12690, partial [Cyanophyceae cyanobacterium]
IASGIGLISVWQELPDGTKVPLLTGKELPAYEAYPFSKLIKGTPFVVGDKFYGSIVSGSAIVSLSLYSGVLTQR